jgi:hypothetical protein
MKESFVCLSHWISQIMLHLAAHLVSLESPRPQGFDLQ